MSATPRPWQVIVYDDSPLGCIVSPGTGAVICTMTPNGQSDLQVKDEAELIVHAVNTLDVMKEAQAALTLSLDTMRGMTDYFEDGLEKAMLDRTVKECKAVLAKLEDPHA